MTIIAPGKTIGILGGGQLGRMMAMAAAQMGYHVHIFSPESDAPAAEVSRDATVADYSDKKALDHFAKSVDVVTLEFENVPVESVEYLAKKIPTRPGAHVLQIAQDRLHEKDFARKLKIGTADYAAVNDWNELSAAVEKLGTPSILKTRRMGYDGKGQFKIRKKSDIGDAWDAIAGAPAILESMVDFRMEISVIVARSPSGEVMCYTPVENRHKNHILDETIVPAPIYPAVAKKATMIARKMAQQIKLQGLMAVEMFVLKNGDIAMNEIAPRPHNSGHWSIDACATSQFEQSIRAACDLPLGSTTILAPCRMKNLLGDDIDHYADILSEPNAKLHLYGKAEPKPGRKMGHVTRIAKK